jgi:hypothetical protein
MEVLIASARPALTAWSTNGSRSGTWGYANIGETMRSMDTNGDEVEGLEGAGGKC